MKKIYYLFTLMVAAATFNACRPMDKTYEALDQVPKNTTYTLSSADYSLLGPSVYASKTKSFSTEEDAKKYIPTILNNGFANSIVGSVITVSYNNQPVLADSVFNNVKYTLVNNADYLLLPGTKYPDFSLAQVLNWLPYKFASPQPNTLKVLTWILYPTIPVTSPQVYPGLTISTTGNTTMATGSFLYLNGNWINVYQINPTQYATVGRGQYNQFTAADDANLVAYINGLLKQDPSVVAKTGAVQYVSFNYYSSTKVTSQRVIALTYNGTDWVVQGNASFAFNKTATGWIPDPSIYYKLTTSDYAYIKTMPTTVNIQSALDNVANYGDFNISTPVSPTTGWTDAQVNAALVLILAHDFPNPPANQNYKVTYVAYNGATVNVTKVFKYSGGTFVYVP